MNSSTVVTTLYAILITVGGIIGYAKAGSVPSLVMGLISGLLVFACAYRLYKEEKGAEMTACVLVVILTFFFTFRFFLTLKFMPAGLMALISLIVAIILSPYSKKQFYR